MRSYPLHYFPYPPIYLLAFLLLLALAFLVLRVGVIGFAYERLGLSRRLAFVTLLAALLGGWVNIPVAQLPAQRVVAPMVVPLFGMQYVIPYVAERGSTVIAINPESFWGGLDLRAEGQLTSRAGRSAWARSGVHDAGPFPRSSCCWGS